MNKTDLINSIAEKSNLSKKDSNTVLNAFIDSVEESLAKGEKIQLIGFGTFLTTERPERIGRNPRTKEEIKIPASIVPKFVAGKDLKEKVSKLSK